MAEESAEKNGRPFLSQVISDLEKRRTVSTETSTGRLELLEYVRMLEKQSALPIQAAPVASVSSAEIERLALLDPLTELCNHRTFVKELKAELNRANRYKSSTSLAIISVDGFDEIIAKYGQLTGDAVLKVVANVLRQTVRDSDQLALFTGQHFAAVMPRTYSAQAALVSERIRQRIANQALTHNWQNFSVTASVGVATAPDHAQDHEGLIARSLESLEYAIERGGDRVFSA